MRELVEARNIEHLVHFTQVANLPGILQYGLLGRESLHRLRAHSQINDHLRLDYVPDAVCCSISFPNYKMFYRLRANNQNTDWVVIRIKPNVLWEKQCAFCISNAAKSAVSCDGIDERKMPEAFSAMFSDHDDMPDRQTLRIPNDYTTDPQAEVLVLEPVEPKYFMDVIVDEKRRINDLQVLTQLIEPYRKQIGFYHNSFYFYPRNDHAHWKIDRDGDSTNIFAK